MNPHYGLTPTHGDSSLADLSRVVAALDRAWLASWRDLRAVSRCPPRGALLDGETGPTAHRWSSRSHADDMPLFGVVASTVQGVKSKWERRFGC